MAWRDRNTVADRSAAQPLPRVALPGEAPPATGLLRNAIAVSAVMAEVVGQIHAFAPAETVVFEGATGTGKSYLAEALHEASGRRGACIDVAAGEIEPGPAQDRVFEHVRAAVDPPTARNRA